jgi:hypothetical protein
MEYFDSILKWITTMSGDKLAFILPLAIGYVIIRAKAIPSNWCWVICPLVAALIFEVTETPDPTKTHFQNAVMDSGVGVLLGLIAATCALSIHSVAFKYLVQKYPWLSFLIQSEEPADKQNTDSPDKKV